MSVHATATFKQAQPVWVRGLHERMNITVGFHCPLHATGEPLTLRLAAANTYRVWINGTWFAYGPARAAHGHLRIDEWDITTALQPGLNHLAIEVVAYRANSFGVLNAPGCLQAEVSTASHPVAWTCAHSGHFSPGVLSQRLRRVKRYSYQRTFTEAYRQTSKSDNWRTEGWGERPYPPFLDNLTDGPTLLPRRMPYPEFPLRPLAPISTGTFTPSPEPVTPFTDRFTEHIGLNLLGFTTDELEIDPTLDWNRCAFQAPQPTQNTTARTALAAGGYADFDLPANLTGCLRLVVTCRTPTKLLAGWAEFRSTDHLDVYQQKTINLISWELAPGTYTLESFEAYTFRHLRLAVTTGALTVESVEQRAYESPARLAVTSPDPAFAAIQRAAVSTFRQNTVDVFMDCPSRERAGWLGDSFFIARAAHTLGHPIDAETAFLENFLLAPDPFFSLPPGMFPMCYPSDHYHPEYIPQWALWLVLQLGDYQKRGGAPALIAAFEPRLQRLFGFFDQHLNADGLLEKIPGWNFVEWSKANGLVQDTNFPTNFLYAAALRSAAELYNDASLLSRAETLTRKALTLSRPEGQPWFRDRALRQPDGTLQVTNDATEICQYSPFFFNLIRPEDQPELWQSLISDFGPGKKHPQVHPANLLFGWVMRFDLLQRAGHHQQLRREILAIFGPMAEKTGTIWEHDQAKGSLCHGFGSYVLSLLRENDHD